MNLPVFANKALQTIRSNSPEILTALGIGGVVSTAYLAHQAGVKVSRDEDADPWASNKEKVQKYWKLYIPTAISGALTITCIVAASKGNSRRTAAAVTAYSLSEKAFSEYREKIVEQVGENKEQKLRDELAQAKVTEQPPKEIIVAGSGTVLCCELFTGRYFRSDMEKLRKAQNDINNLVNNSLYVPLDEFYYRIGLPNTSISGNIGWSEKQMDLEFSTVLSDNNEPCLAFDYNYTKPLK